MAEIKSIHNLDLIQDKQELKEKLSGGVWDGQIQVHEHQRSDGFGSFHYLKIYLQGNKSIGIIVSPYDLLVFAQQILKELDPAKQ